MLTFNEAYSNYLTFTKDSSSANTTLGKALVNLYEKELLGLSDDWPFMEKLRTASTVVNQPNYRLPPDHGQFIDVKVTVSGNDYVPSEVTDTHAWFILTKNASSMTSDIVTHFAIIEDYLYFYPTPASAGNTITLLFKRDAPEMTTDDYTTGTISNTKGSRIVTGSGMTFTSAMVGRYVKISGLWYEISAYVSVTGITLAKATITGCSAATYKIGEMSVLPGEFHDLLYIGPVAEYLSWKGDPTATRWENRFEKRQAIFLAKHGGGQKTTSRIIPSQSRLLSLVRNPNYPPGIISEA